MIMEVYPRKRFGRPLKGNGRIRTSIGIDRNYFDALRMFRSEGRLSDTVNEALSFYFAHKDDPEIPNIECAKEGCHATFSAALTSCPNCGSSIGILGVRK